MQIHRYSEYEDLELALQKGEPMLAVIDFNGSEAWMGHIDECMEHYILLAKAGLSQNDIDKYFRIVFDKNEANWTFICPPNYRGIQDKTRRISTFYKDGFAVISEFLAELGLLVDIKIPKRFQRHIVGMEEN